MADQDVHKQEFILRNLQTRSVTLYPTKAQIVRDLHGITLKPGANQITIEGLTPTVDEHSVKVEGTGAATITDLSVQLVQNKELYEEIYPSDDEDDETSDDDDGETPDKKDKPINVEIKKLEAERAAVAEEESSARARLVIIDQYGETLKKDRPLNLEKFLQVHQAERAKAFAESTTAHDKNVELNSQIVTLYAKSARLNKAALKEKEKEQRKKQKALVIRNRKREEVRLEKARIKAERVKFWPKKVYKVVISLDASPGVTPASSRRASVEDLVKVATPTEAQSVTSAIGDINLSISYITYSASWSPRYDLSLNSVTCSGTLDYCAELKNTTSEIWRETKVVLSTSQTSYQGLDDTIPVLQPWNVHLIKGSHSGKSYTKNASNASNALYSQYEQDQKAKCRSEIPAQILAPRGELFGLNSHDSDFYRPAKKQAMSVAQQSLPVQSRQPAMQMMQTQRGTFETRLTTTTQMQPLFGASSSVHSSAGATGLEASWLNSDNDLSDSQRARRRAGGFGAPVTTSLFGASANAGPLGTNTSSNAIGGANLFGQSGFLPNLRSSARREVGAPGGGGLSPDDLDLTDLDSSLGGAPEVGQGSFGGLYDADTIAAQDPALLFEESSFSDSGLTTTFDVPTLKTLSPQSSTTKHKIARIEFKSVVFSHVLIPKLKAAAYLKARLRNSSKVALLKGPAGLTLDGSFLGQSSIPRCSAGESFTLPLGADPTISVSYAKPTVRRSQSGIFNKEDCEVFTRLATVTNTKANAAVELLVLDQVPVSEDERLRIEIASPRGLRAGGDSVTAGQGLSIGVSGATSNDDDDAASISGTRSAASKSRLSVYSDSGSKSSETTTAGKKSSRWGSAIASAKKDGEISWNVKILPLRGCKLVLEYEATYPNGETVQGIN